MGAHERSWPVAIQSSQGYLDNIAEGVALR
jgi:hypothetical protein